MCVTGAKACNDEEERKNNHLTSSACVNIVATPQHASTGGAIEIYGGGDANIPGIENMCVREEKEK